MLTFRFDDISSNSDLDHADFCTAYLKSQFPTCEIIYAVSLVTHNTSGEDGKHKQRVYPKTFNALSDWKQFLRPDNVAYPEFQQEVKVASHGLLHIDHRLMSLEQQEMSVLLSCSLLKSKIFVPPYNKWDKNTDAICYQNGIKLVKFEDGWLSMEHNRFNPNHKMWYLHDREFTKENFIKYIENAS